MPCRWANTPGVWRPTRTSRWTWRTFVIRSKAWCGGAAPACVAIGRGHLLEAAGEEYRPLVRLRARPSSPSSEGWELQNMLTVLADHHRGGDDAERKLAARTSVWISPKPTMPIGSATAHFGARPRGTVPIFVSTKMGLSPLTRAKVRVPLALPVPGGARVVAGENGGMAHRKTVRHFHEVGHLHELTFSCYRRLPLLTGTSTTTRSVEDCVAAAWTGNGRQPDTTSTCHHGNSTEVYRRFTVYPKEP